ncbi:surface carbohydrate biosynthesis protein [Nitratifractor sp.]
MKPRIVILVDNKKRDLPGSALLAYHLEQRGIEVFLEPLEAWRACLAAHKPHMILFNHLLGSHLVQYSQELHSRGILVGVLPNEGILYDKEVLAFNAAKFHNQAHIDYFFVWNQAHKEAIEEGNDGSIRHVEVVGVPRFDFYFPPLAPKKTSPSPTILLCSNFVFAQYADKDPGVADKLFAPWKERVSSYRDYWKLIHTNHRSRKKFFEFLESIRSFPKEYHFILKPHPGEDHEIYKRWYSKLSEEEKRHIRLDTQSYIWELIPQCDIEIACETCTTTLESWIAGKPTIELLLEKAPPFYHEFLSRMSLTCDTPSKLKDRIDLALSGDSDKVFKPEREKHLAKWCDSPSGHSTEKLSKIISEALQDTHPDFSRLDWSHKRKGLKLKLLSKLNLPYNYNPFSISKLFNPKKYLEKKRIIEKNIRPSDVKEWRGKIDDAMKRSQKEPSK